MYTNSKALPIPENGDLQNYTRVMARRVICLAEYLKDYPGIPIIGIPIGSPLAQKILTYEKAGYSITFEDVRK